MSRRGALLGCAVLLAGAALVPARPSRAAAAGVAPGPGAAAPGASPRERYQKRFTGKPAPDFSLYDLAGNTVTLAQERGHVVLLNFWYSSCVPCRRETPDLATLHKTYSLHGFKVLGINLDDLLIPDAGGASLKVFLQEFKPPYPILLGSNDVMEAYGGVPVQPISFLIDRRGMVAKVFWGAYPGAVFEQAIRAQLEGSTAPR
ncbi:MAG TPA: TlpA disulfide reductase family protein [Candidatus Polarisedimenticolia bacterium]|nr:TlpA disulfide reductase family protein [Candidatus Polarisedimenticolia bacterium]